MNSKRMILGAALYPALVGVVLTAALPVRAQSAYYRPLTLAPDRSAAGDGAAAAWGPSQLAFYRPLTLAPAESGGGGGSAASESEQLAAIGQKLSNPVSDAWALFTEFDLYFSDGDANQGAEKVGGRMLFQPVLPFPLYGEGQDRWSLITRPTVPVLFSQPVPTGPDQFTHLGGLGDTQLPLLVVPPTGNLLLGAGPTWLLPTATRSEFGRQQWGVGPAVVLGYKTKDWIGGVFPQYTFHLSGWNDGADDASYLSMLYFFFYNLPGGWQIGSNPTVNYDYRQTAGNKWNVPIGLTIAKMIKIGRTPVKLQLGIEYSVVHEDDFGQRAQIKLNIIPVMPNLVKRPILGGN